MRDDALNDITLTAPAGAPPDTPQVNINQFPVPTELATFYAVESGTMYAVDLRRIDSHNYGYVGLVVITGGTSPLTVTGVVNNGVVVELSRVQGNTIDTSDVSLVYGARNPVSLELDQGLYLFTGAFTETRWDNTALARFNPGAKLQYDTHDVLAAWEAWPSAPVWSSVSNPQPAIGNGSLTGEYRLFGKTADIRIVLTAAGDGTTTFGTGNWQFTLPVTGRASRRQLLPVMAIDNSSGGGNGGWARIEGGSNAILRIHSPAGNFAAAAPFAWAASDSCVIEGTIETG